MKRLVNAITCMRFVLRSFWCLRCCWGRERPRGLRRAAGLSALEELVLHAWMPAPDVRGLLWIEKPRR